MSIENISHASKKDFKVLACIEKMIGKIVAVVSIAK